MTDYLPNVRDYLQRFFGFGTQDSRFQNYRRQLKDLKKEQENGGYGSSRFDSNLDLRIVGYKAPEVIGAFESIILGTHIKFGDLRIPEGFPTPGDLVFALEWFHDFLDQKNEMFSEIFDHYEAKGEKVPGWVIRIDDIYNEVLSAVDHVLTLEEVLPYRRLEPKATEGTEGETEPVKMPENLFHNKGEYWEIAFQGGEISHIQDRVGLKYIHLLLSNPNKPFSAVQMSQVGQLDPEMIKGNRPIDYDHMSEDQLEREEGLKKVGLKNSPDKIINSKEILILKNRLEKIGEELEKSYDDDPEQRSLLEEEQEEILNSLKNRRTPIIDDIKKPRQAVTKAINEAREKIGEHSPELKKYLDQTIKTGKDCIYHPLVDLPITWTF